MPVGWRDLDERNVYREFRVRFEERGYIRKKYRGVAGAPGVDRLADILARKKSARGKMPAPAFVSVGRWPIGVEMGDLHIM